MKRIFIVLLVSLSFMASVRAETIVQLPVFENGALSSMRTVSVPDPVATSEEASKAEDVWLLLVNGVVLSGGFSSQAQCEAAAQQMTQTLHDTTGKAQEVQCSISSDTKLE